jgi:hypothetical protein
VETNKKNISEDKKKSDGHDKPAVDIKPKDETGVAEKTKEKVTVQLKPTANEKAATDIKKNEHDHNIGNGSKNQLFIVEGFNKIDESSVGTNDLLSSE